MGKSSEKIEKIEPKRPEKMKMKMQTPEVEGMKSWRSTQKMSDQTLLHKNPLQDESRIKLEQSWINE